MVKSNKQNKSISSRAGTRSIKAMPQKKTNQKTKAQSLSSSNPFSKTNTLFHRLRDRDLIYNVITPLAGANSSIRIPTNPRFWPNTRAFQESLGWQTYCPHRIVVRWLPSVAATTAGQIIGGTIYKSQTINASLIANALLATAKSYAGPVWEPCSWEIDLSALTQPKYLLNETEEDGVPCDMFIVLPQTAVGLLTLEYDISFFGHSTAPVSVPVYDLVPRNWSSPADLTSADGTMSSNVGLVNSNFYKATIVTSSTANANVQLTPTSGGGGPISIDCGFFNSQVNFYIGAAGKGAFREGQTTNLYLNLATYENQLVPIWLSGPAN